MGGCPLLVVEPGKPGDGSALAHTWRPDLLLTSEANAGATVLSERPGWRADVADLPRPHPALRLLLSRSGSTGDPKLVRLSGSNIASNAASIAEYLQIRPSDRAATTLPLFYYGLSVLHSYLLAGAVLVLITESITDAIFWESARQSKVTSLALMPHQLELLNSGGFDGMELPSLRYVTQAGGRLSPDTVRRFWELGQGGGWQLFVMYGQTEAAPRISYVPTVALPEAGDTIGRPIPGALAVGGRRRPRDPPDRPAGELVYEGPNVMMDYAMTRPDLARGAELQELRTGDLAELTADAGIRHRGPRGARTAPRESGRGQSCASSRRAFPAGAMRGTLTRGTVRGAPRMPMRRGLASVATVTAWAGLMLCGCSFLHDDNRTDASDLPDAQAGRDQCTPSAVGDGGYPLPALVGHANDCNTGPRHECESSTEESFETTHDGQVIEGVCINGSLEIRHDDVVVRDVLVMGTGTYALDIGEGMESCPTNLRVEYTEVNMDNAGPTDWGIYQRCAGGHVFDHVKVMHAGRGVLSYGDVTFNQSYVYSNRTKPDAHRTAFSTHGGNGFTITDNTFICVNSGCSSAINIYSDYAPATDVVIEGNVLAGGSICLRGGETHDYGEQTRDIRVIDNRFSTLYAPECGTHQVIAQFDENAPGNVRSGNVWHESGRPLDGE